jgi:hypothetical protein
VVITFNLERHYVYLEVKNKKMSTITLNKIGPKYSINTNVKSIVNKALFGISILDLVMIAIIYFVISIPQVKVSLVKSQPQFVSAGPSTNAFIKQLPAGVVIVPLEVKRENLSISGRMIVMDNDNLAIFEYPNSDLAQKEAFQLSKKYESTQNSPEWKENMRLYLKSNLLIFYMGRKNSIISYLNQGPSVRVDGGGEISMGNFSVVSKSGDYYK